MWWPAIAAWMLTSFSAVGARSLAHFSRSQLDELCQRRQNPARLGVILHRYSWVALGMEAWEVLGGAIFLAAFVWAFGQQHSQQSIAVGLWMLSGVGAAVALWAGMIWIPSAIAQLAAAEVVYFLWRLWETLAALMLPAI
ncbi:MAG TPA: hypothetical protein PLQ00_03415, partial [Thermoguttaceae bacterium]|nr:hypothetical protein [Thermoguttaceae bacterium]